MVGFDQLGLGELEYLLIMAGFQVASLTCTWNLSDIGEDHNNPVSI